ncbi:beta-phosphoglucomutase [Thalassobacillus pellis]|uniref:beta-phosphoglucomutase n=1 Tax=Thalassobacillus pellis TaxID=748008 RepID=UPI00195FEB9F|nr:beta-phosphoglucomutase [Thalassobacillus pellis]MBM7555045.1 beta-phosphoglucomutase [Thalassobacillus pellis]
MKQISGILFDLDGVITDTAEYHYKAWKQLADDLDIPFDREFNEKLKGIGRMESLELILQHGNKQLTAEEKERQATKKNEHYKQMIELITPADILPGVLEFMNEIKDAGVKTALASSSKNAQAVIENLEITHLLDSVVNAAEIKNGKPAPEIFLKAADQLGLSSENCAGVEDAQAGVEAIKAAEMFAVGVGDQKALKKADWVVEDTSQLDFKELQQKFAEARS